MTFPSRPPLAVQPAADDVMAYESIQAGTIALPSHVPDVPTDLSDDLGTLYFSVCYDVFTQLLR